MSSATASSGVTLNIAGGLNPFQEEALNDLESPFLLVSAGNGAGKTTLLVLKALQLFSLNPGVPGLVTMQVESQFKAVFIYTLKRILRRAGADRRTIKRYTTLRGNRGEWYLDWGDPDAPIHMRTSKSYQNWDGLEVGWAVGDEIRYWPWDAYRVHIARCRVKCPVRQRFYASTPDMNWMADEFDEGKPERRVIFASTLENERNLQPDYVASLRGSYSPEMQEAMIEGQFVLLSGSVFKRFNRRHDHWFVDYEHQHATAQGKETFLAIDPGYRRSSVLWVRELNPEAPSWVVFHQMQLDNTSMREVVDQIIAWNAATNTQIDRIWVDPAAETREITTGTSVMKELRRIPQRGRKRSIFTLAGRAREVLWGIEKVRSMIGDPRNDIQPRIFFSEHLRNGEKSVGMPGAPARGIIRSLAGLKYPEHKPDRPIDDNPLKEGVFEHAVDALRYLVVGLYVTNPKLRRMLEITKQLEGQDGFRMAA